MEQNKVYLDLDETKKYYAIIDGGKKILLKGFDYDRDKKVLSLVYDKGDEMRLIRYSDVSENDFFAKFEYLKNTGIAVF